VFAEHDPTAAAVEEDFQSRGIGSLLMRHIIAIAY
jgi:ribosomal protein S18 acetylase RimI-like enzyme